MDHRRQETVVSGALLVLAASLVGVVNAAACVIPISSNAPSDASTSGNQADVVASDGNRIDGSVVSSEGSVAGAWVNRTGNLAGMSSECGNLAGLFSKPDEDLLIASVALNGLWGSRDGGATWTALSPNPADGGNITNRGLYIAFDPVDHSRFWESGIYHPAGVYETSNEGMTFTPLGSATHCDCVTVDFTDPNRQTLLAGGHEMGQTLYRSTNGGMTWTNVGGPLPSNTNCTYPLALGPLVHLVGCGGYGGGSSGVYMTTDGGATWTLVTSAGGSGPPLHASDGSIYWATPNNGGTPNSGGITRSTDSGQHWTANMAASTVSSKPPIELPDGRLAAIGAQSVIVVSADHGATWRAVSTALPYNDAVGIVYSSHHKAFYVWHFSCGVNGPVPVPSDAVMGFPFDYQTG
jgi:hypothetical protein